MPKLKQSETDQLKQSIAEGIKSLSRIHYIPIDELAVYCGVSKATFYSRLRKPGDFTLDELIRIFPKLHIKFPLEKISEQLNFYKSIANGQEQ